ncbi:hypothetical protein FA15DRAFT_408076 [Coprinopsis marcescibilis]|uniref:Uncharacterized protein n=1 Tax=Coprinopsis marcescibilis TaxID=230819 RepID=A0A5C3KA21_COPMA|nr:hypothetical protein FA15DRAFT_408076 [Coprinopsis marcescibilis]
MRLSDIRCIRLCQMLMYWSWVPAIAFGVTLFSLVVKIPIEEDTIDQDPVIGDDYRKYKRVVPWRLVPGVW